MSSRRRPPSPADAGLPPDFAPDPIAGEDNQVVGLFVAGPIGALVGRVLAATIKNAGVGTFGPPDFDAAAPKAKPPAVSSPPAKKAKPKSAAGGKSPVPKRRKRRPS